MWLFYWALLTTNSDKTREMPMEKYEQKKKKQKEKKEKKTHRIYINTFFPLFILSKHRQIFYLLEAIHR